MATTETDFAAMRLGKAVAEFVPLQSRPGERVAIVPLTEAEFENSLRLAASEDVPDNQMGIELRERIQTREIVWAAHRDPADISIRRWGTAEEMAEDIEHAEINHIFDHYLEMVDKSSPAAEGVGEEEFEALKKVLQEIPMSELSGRQWYALKRFLGSILPQLLRANSPGSISTSLSTWMNEGRVLAPSASESGTTPDAKSAERP